MSDLKHPERAPNGWLVACPCGWENYAPVPSIARDRLHKHTQKCSHKNRKD